MSTIAIIMLVLFIVVIWGGLILSLVHLQRNPDESSGILGNSEKATDEVLISQEYR
ncbi:methionine/alanine import NSS transporter subunit MetS [Corynebacterium sp. sy017]|uniref:methionine/alanine import NSS transporter subunit MetS n=1 Tax=unclassified Corynebacterium TaxID=2624378 RepID=UPI001185E468|nr:MULTISPECIES: methionine/alanine import NSS transporter subunit MetS [unclassified Corynebacterium]MBP3088927.1 methionine/alanine import NSS transporter subunit MetS [Corynebacterium sp. sy017]QDZ42304.1 methionine/alanine import NSS transporter subunit MetS [Corynebacterium sp. sy039]TSD91255.1 methionine/alanine import NSS transporter subunit MetS [Corynebacterium sp. SY003]